MVSIVIPPGGRQKYRTLTAPLLGVFLVTYVLALQATFTTTHLFIKLWSLHPAITILGIIWHSLLMCMALWSHWMCTLSDPGRVPAIQDDHLIEDALRCGFTDCPKCKSVRPRRAHHCSICKCCILHMDHHCPWVGNCIGFFNQKFFFQYTTYIFLVGATELTLTSAIALDMYHLYNMNVDLLLDKYGSLLMVAAVVNYFVAIVFTMFALTLCIDQIFNIYRNTTAIDKLKRVAPRPQRFKQTMIHVFGCNPCWKWLLPLPSKPSYMGDKLTPSDILALSVFDDSDAVLPDYNHEFQDLFTESPTQRRWLPKCACFRRMTDTTNEV